MTWLRLAAAGTVNFRHDQLEAHENRHGASQYAIPVDAATAGSLCPHFAHNRAAVTDKSGDLR